MNKMLILTHGDCDGVCSAAQVKYIHRDSDVFFTHPHGILEDLTNKYDPQVKEIYILDIAFDESIWKEIVKKLNRISQVVNIFYIDHHPPPKKLRRQNLNFEYVNMKGCSTSEIVYKLFSDKISFDLSRVALFGAIGDYSDETRFVKELYDLWDKRMIYFEGGLLSQALEGSRREYEFKRKILTILSENKLPSNYDFIVEKAIKMTKEEEEMRNTLGEKAIILKNISYVIDIKGSLGRAAKYLISLTKKPVGAAVEHRKKNAIISFRTRRQFINLNELLRKNAIKYGGSGGGHEEAAGARVPYDSLDEFMENLDNEIAKLISSKV